MITLKFAVVLLFLHRGLFAPGDHPQFPGAETQAVGRELYYQGLILFGVFLLLIEDRALSAAGSFSSLQMKAGVGTGKKSGVYYQILGC